MDDNSGKKFSLQDWVLKRAANQPSDVAAVLRASLDKADDRTAEAGPETVSSAAASGRDDMPDSAQGALRAIERLERLERRAEMRMRNQKAAFAPKAEMSQDKEEDDFQDEDKETEVLSHPVDAVMADIRAAIKAEVGAEVGAEIAKVEAKIEAKEAEQKSKEKEQPATRPSIAATPVSPPPTAPRHVTAASMTNVAASAALAAAPKPATASATPAPNTGALQQLQVVRLLQELGERLRQSEREREILWKEVELFKKLLAEMEEKNGRAEKAYKSLEEQVAQRDTKIQDLNKHQDDLEQEQKRQEESVEQVKQGQHKVEEKMSSLETTAGSVIVRIEDALSESDKLSKKLDQIGQDKVRLIRKIETMEEALTQTQDTLKAKALVLLTDQALAARTSLPQTPAWSGGEAKAAALPAAAREESSPVAALKKSLQPQAMSAVWQTVLLAAVAAIAIGSGIAIGKSQIFSSAPPLPEETSRSSESSDSEVDMTEPVSQNQDELMGQIAQLANQIEPGSAAAEGKIESAAQTQSAEEIIGQEEAAAKEAFDADKPEGDLATRLRRDSGLPKPIRDIEESALAGDAEFQHDLAAIYVSGQAGVKVNYSRAADWFREASYGGIANAQYNLGVLYHQGLGVQQDTKKALTLYRVAAASGHAEAAYNLGIAHVEGVGVTYNPQIAAAYFERAAEGGVAEAGYNLGLIYENGLLGGESQPDEAIFWYRLAAEGGNKQAKDALTHLTKQLGMNEEDVLRLVKRMAVAKPGFFDAKTGSALVFDKAPEAAQGETVAPPPAPEKTSSAVPKKAEKLSAPKAVKAETDPVIVAQVQEQLIRMGLYPGPADGVVNEMTQDAVRSYQQQSGLKVDGQPNDDVLVHMLAAGLYEGQ